MRRRALGGVLGLVGAVAAAAGPVVWAAPARAATPAEVTAVGWWTRRPGAGAQPPGGFEVAAGLDGPESVAALRIAVGAPLARAVLVLGEREGLLQEQAAMRVCPAADGWSPANPGPFDGAPAADCARHVALARNAAQANWTADVTALLGTGGTVSLAILPLRREGVVVDPGFQVRFATASLLVEAAEGGQAAGGEGAGDEAGGEGGGRGPFGGASGDMPDATAQGAPGDVGGLVGLGPPPGPGGVVPAAPGDLGTPAVPGAPGASGAPAGGAGSALASGPLPSSGLASLPTGGRARPWWRLAIVLPASALVGLATAAARRRFAGGSGSPPAA